MALNIFTSISANYLPKARVLAASVKRFHPDAVFHLVLCDRRPESGAPGLELFDHVHTLEDLPIPNPRAWAFEHTLVELCTAVKGPASRKLLAEHGGDLLYFDPDIAVLAPLDPLLAELSRHPVLLTPHQTEPDQTHRAIQDNEICSLKHGVFNLGFLGLRASEGGRRFVDWWAERLLHYCFDDKLNGLFTDQRWVDLAPCFFPEVGILRDKQYNVATWNLSRRRVTGTAPHGLRIDGKPVVFFHFSGFDSGAQEIMLWQYAADSPGLWKLRQWYLDECERQGQSREGKVPCVWGAFADGTPITNEQRLLYRTRGDVRAHFPDPYDTSDVSRSYLHWWRANAEAAAPVVVPALGRPRLAERIRARLKRMALAYPILRLPLRYHFLRQGLHALSRGWTRTRPSSEAMPVKEEAA